MRRTRSSALRRPGEPLKQTAARLKNLQWQLQTDNLIGKHLGMTRQAVYQWRKKLGIPATTEQRSARNFVIAKRYLHGHKAQMLADAYDLSVAQVYRIIKACS